MTKNDGSGYEKLVEHIYRVLAAGDRFTSVEHNVQLPGPDGPRQIDVLVRSLVAGLPLTMILECRDHNRILEVGAIDAFQSKITDVNANKGVIVAKKGFSRTAIRKGKRLGITLCTASSADETLSRIGVQIPIVITEIQATLSSSSLRVHLDAGSTIDGRILFTVNDRYVPELLRDEILQGIYVCPQESCLVDWEPSSLSPPYSVRDMSGKPHPVERPLFRVSIEAAHFFGHINDLPAALAMHDFTAGSTTVFLKAEDLPDYKKNLAQYTSKADIPSVTAIQVVSMNLPTAISSVSFQTTNVATGETVGPIKTQF